MSSVGSSSDASAPRTPPGRGVRGGGRLAGVDMLRGIAVLGVLVAHLQFSWSLAPSRGAETAPAFSPLASALADYGRFGVGLFLVISGFCIHLGWARVVAAPPAVGFVRFWQRRLVRLYPPYVLALAFSVVGLLVLYAVLGGARGLPEALGYGSSTLLATDLASLVLLLQNVTGASERIGNGPFWTLALEEQLYAMYFVLLAIRWRFGWGPALVVVAGSTLAWRLVPFVAPQELPLWYGLGPSRWIEWVLGAVAAEVHVGRIRIPSWSSSLRVAAVLLATAALVAAPVGADWLTLAGRRRADGVYGLALFVSDIAFGLAFFVVINAAARWERGRTGGLPGAVALLAGVGLFSYSLYLTHEPVVVAAKQAVLRIGLAPGTLLSTAVVVVARFSAAILAAYAFYRLFEIHAIRASRRTAAAMRAESALVAGPIPADRAPAPGV